MKARSRKQRFTSRPFASQPLGSSPRQPLHTSCAHPGRQLHGVGKHEARQKYQTAGPEPAGSREVIPLTPQLPSRLCEELMWPRQLSPASWLPPHLSGLSLVASTRYNTRTQNRVGLESGTVAIRCFKSTLAATKDNASSPCKRNLKLLSSLY